MRSWLLIWVYVLAVGAALVAVRVEWLNRAVERLPCRPFLLDGELRHPGPWRSWPWTTESAWRRALGPRDDAGEPVQRPLTADETAQMQRDIRRAHANNELRDLVHGPGLLLYLVVPVLLLLSVVQIARTRKQPRAVLAALPPLVIGLAVAAHMYWLDYVSGIW